MLAQIGAAQPSTRPSGQQCLALVVPGAWLLAAVDGVVENAQIHWTRQRCARTVAQLSQQLDDSWRDLALAALQVPSHWSAVPYGTARPDQPYLPTLWGACENLSFALRSQRSREMGKVDVL
jgi:hypothetical protein